MFSTVRRQLTIGFIGLAITPLLLAGLVSSSASFRAQEQQALALQQAIARRFASEINLLIGQIENELRQLTRVGSFSELTIEDEAALLSEMIAYQDGLESVAVLDGNGQEQARVERMRFVTDSDLGDWSARAEFLIPSTSGVVHYGPLNSDEATGEPLMTLAYPLTNLRTGAVDGVLVGEIRFKKVWDLIRDSSPPGTEEIYVVDERDFIVAHASPSVVLRAGGTRFELPAEHGITTGLDGDEVVMAWAELPIGEQTLYVVAEQPVSEALALAYQSLYVTVGLLAGALIVSAVAGVLAVRQIVRPIEQLAETAQKIAAGDLSQRAQVESAAEIEALAESFNSMTGRLVTTLDGLEALNADLERRVAERTAELQTANSRLTELDRLKTLFIRDMSHELRTPLSILGTSLYLIEKRPERSAEFLRQIKNQIERLTHLANNALELSRLEQTDVVFEPVSLNEVIEQAAGRFRERARESGLTFTVSLAPQPTIVHGERDQLVQVVTHLLTNAINYTQAGGVEISTLVDAQQVCLTVRDTGRGIAPEDLPHVFERFYRGQGIGSSNISGSGLGLSIVRQIVDSHRGRIQIESAVEAGTTVRLWLPLLDETHP